MGLPRTLLAPRTPSLLSWTQGHHFAEVLGGGEVHSGKTQRTQVSPENCRPKIQLGAEENRKRERTGRKRLKVINKLPSSGKGRRKSICPTVHPGSKWLFPAPSLDVPHCKEVPRPGSRDLRDPWAPVVLPDATLTLSVFLPTAGEAGGSACGI